MALSPVEPASLLQGRAGLVRSLPGEEDLREQHERVGMERERIRRRGDLDCVPRLRLGAGDIAAAQPEARRNDPRGDLEAGEVGSPP